MANERKANRATIVSRFVRPDEFLKMLLSRKSLVRADNSDAGIRGLLDPKTDQQFLVERRQLCRFRKSRQA